MAAIYSRRSSLWLAATLALVRQGVPFVWMGCELSKGQEKEMGIVLQHIWGPKIGDPENPRVYHEYPFKRDYCIPPYSKRTPKPLVRVGEVTMSPLMHKPLGHWASDRGRGVGLLFLGQRQSGVYQPGLRVHRLAGECRREAQTMEWMLPEKVKSGWDGKKGSIFG